MIPRLHSEQIAPARQVLELEGVTSCQGNGEGGAVFEEGGAGGCGESGGVGEEVCRGDGEGDAGCAEGWCEEGEEGEEGEKGGDEGGET